MSIEGQGHFFTIYFPSFVCFMLYLDKISGERLQDHWSSGSVLKTATVVYLRAKDVMFVRLFGLRLYVPVNNFSVVPTEPPLPGYYQYFLRGKFILLKDTTWQPE